MKHLRHLTFIIVLVALLAGCGDDDEEETPTATTSDQAAATETTAPTARPDTPTSTATSRLILINGLQQPVAGETIDDYGILAVEPDGQNLHRIDPEGMQDAFPVWSPDGERIAFTRFLTPMDESDTPRSVIMTMNADGSDEQVLTDEQELAYNPVWSPDGTQIAFNRVEDPSVQGEEWQISAAVMNADGSDIHDLDVGTGIVNRPSWSPDGEQIVVSGIARETGASMEGAAAFVTIVGADGSDPRQILNASQIGNKQVISADWSPDGTKIALVRFNQDVAARLREASVETTGAVLSLWTIEPDGGRLRELARDELLAAFFPAWSPDSSRMTFVGWEDFANTGIYTINTDGTQLQKVGEGLTGDAAQGPEAAEGALLMAPSWSPDGNWVAYLAVPVTGEEMEGPVASAELRLAAGDGSDQRTLVTGIYVEPAPDPFDSMGSTAPAWQPEGE